ncbi:MAG: hypothetical protein CVU03_08150 [Bacteroidetes bacterium HGW-Bacteroidetes-2]|jgi:hypothetical protein|nr:MAG: hypothetical protein CVU03_08150 [Bacteroidetes bacterium HGW-Bacteroidetes-2]
MKNMLLTFAILQCFLFFGNAQNVKLPVNAQEFILLNFPKERLLKVEENKDNYEDRFEVKLSNKIELDFNADGEITKMESESGLPNSVIPKEILSHVLHNYPDKTIKEWQLKPYGQEIELNNEVELKFNAEGRFIKN